MKKMIYVLILWFSLSACERYNDSNPNQIQDGISVKSTPTYNVIVQENITYGRGLSHQTLNSVNYSTIDLKLDAYIPENNIEKRPAILLIHGGGFSLGNKSDQNIVTLANYFASRGWVAFSINYRLLSHKGTVPNEWIQYAQANLPSNQIADLLEIYPAHRDGKTALRWIFANSHTFNIDTAYMTVGGGSAGAAIANALGITEPEDYTNEISISTDPTLSTVNINQNYSVHTILDFWGSKETIDVLHHIYGHQRFGANDAPMFIAHGTDDATVAFTKAEELRDEYIVMKSIIDFNHYKVMGTVLGMQP